MIIGHGDIASVLVDREGFTFFASGISNSQEMRENEYNREYNLLMKQDINSHLVYFSSLCIFYAHTRYAEHKRYMELEIKYHFPHYTILRLGNITWGVNPHTLINHLREQRRSGQVLEIRDTYRYIVDQGEFLHWVSLIPEWSCEMNITGRRMTVRQIVDELV